MLRKVTTDLVFLEARAATSKRGLASCLSSTSQLQERDCRLLMTTVTNARRKGRGSSSTLLLCHLCVVWTSRQASREEYRRGSTHQLGFQLTSRRRRSRERVTKEECQARPALGIAQPSFNKIGYHDARLSDLIAWDYQMSWHDEIEEASWPKGAPSNLLWPLSEVHRSVDEYRR